MFRFFKSTFFILGGFVIKNKWFFLKRTISLIEGKISGFNRVLKRLENAGLDSKRVQEIFEDNVAGPIEDRLREHMDKADQIVLELNKAQKELKDLKIKISKPTVTISYGDDISLKRKL